MIRSVVYLSLVLPCSAIAQDVVVTVNPQTGTFSAEYFGSRQLIQMFSNINVRLSGDAPITITSESPIYTNPFAPTGAEITGNSTDEVTFIGNTLATNPLFGPIDSSNPFEPFGFSYGGSLDELSVDFYGYTTATLSDLPFASDHVMVHSNGNLGSLSYRVEIVPAPASASVLGAFAMVGVRRRR